MQLTEYIGSNVGIRIEVISIHTFRIFYKLKHTLVIKLCIVFEHFVTNFVLSLYLKCYEILNPLTLYSRTLIL
jgi:hypothetical protein